MTKSTPWHQVAAVRCSRWPIAPNVAVPGVVGGSPSHPARAGPAASAAAPAASGTTRPATAPRKLGLSEAELIVTREELHRLFDQLWVLECAVADVERDLAAAKTIADHREALAWLLDAARPVVALNR